MKCIYKVLLDSTCILKYYVVLTNFYNFLSVLTLAREKLTHVKFLDGVLVVPVFTTTKTTKICESLKLYIFFFLLLPFFVVFFFVELLQYWMDTLQGTFGFCFTFIIPKLMPTVLYVRVRA